MTEPATVTVLQTSEELVRLHTGDLVPQQFIAVVEHADVPYSTRFGIKIAESGEPWVQSVAVVPLAGAAPVSVTDAMRGIAQHDVDFIVRYATSVAAALLLPAPSETAAWPNLPDRTTPDGKIAWDRVLTQASVGVGVRVHKRRRINDELLARVAAVYRTAVDEGRTDPTVAVADKEFVSRSTAAKYVMAARRRGILGPAVGRRGGEVEGDS